MIRHNFFLKQFSKFFSSLKGYAPELVSNKFGYNVILGSRAKSKRLTEVEKFFLRKILLVLVLIFVMKFSVYFGKLCFLNP